ncbi:MAG: hypothetical protein JRI66_12305 [Deltaproteobacteria bacterium]|nr:hypothetical protein [Deltaproteobacteria bacterium]
MGPLGMPDQILLTAALLFGAGLGFGAASGKGWVMLQKFKNGGKPPPKDDCSECQKIRDLMADMIPCKYHSGLEANIAHLLNEMAHVRGTVGEIWSSINELRRYLYSKGADGTN